MKNHLPTIIFKAIKHKAQRYETVGDFYKSHGVQNFRVSKMDADSEFLVFLHELIEWYLTQRRGITQKQVDEFDMQFERDRKAGLYSDDVEPGDSIDAPYMKEHKFATTVERMLARECGVDWEEYDKKVMNL